MFAVVDIKGKQYKFEIDQEYKIDLINSQDKKLKFTDVLLFCDGKNNFVGKPKLDNVSVEAEIVGDVKEKKIRVTKFRAKKRYKKMGGHRTQKTVIKIIKINNSKVSKSNKVKKETTNTK